MNHVADEYQAQGGAHDGTSHCGCGPCVATSLRRNLHPGIVGVRKGTTVILKRASEDSQ